MCGLLGLVRTNQSVMQSDFEKLIRLLFIVDQVRGEHSTGLFAVHEKFDRKNDCPVVLKKAMNAMDFVGLPFYKALMNDIKNYTFFAGHNRYATKGLVTNNNAHPFQIRNITLMHNGTIHGFGKFSKDAENVVVDSMAITYLLTHHSLVDVLKELNGSYCLVYHDANDNSFNIIRNDDRPLLMGETAFGYVYSSEDWMLEAADAYSGIRIKDIQSIKPYQHYKFVTTQSAKGAINSVALEIVDYTTELEPKKHHHHGHNHGKNYAYGYYDDWKSGDGGYYGNKRLPPPNPPQNYPTSKEMLANHKLTIDQVVEFEFKHFESQNDKGPNRFWGSAFGELKAKPGISTIFHNCPAEFYEAIMEGQEDYTLSGKIISAFMRPNYTKNSTVNSLHVTLGDVEALAISEGKTTYKMLPKSRGKSDGGDFLQIVEVTKEPVVAVKKEGGGFLEVAASDWARASTEGCIVCTGYLDLASTTVDKDNDFWCDTCAQVEDADKNVVSNIVQMALAKGKIH
jgi:hypothetical protein